MATEAAFWGDICFRLQQKRVCWDLQDVPRRFYEAVPGRQVILAVCEATSGAALTNVANLEAAPEVRKTKSL